MEPSMTSGSTKRFDIPLTHLEFDYVKSCSNVKELEKILKVLRSNEEGYFPDLERCCEDRLTALNPSSRVLRRDKPVGTKGDLDIDEREELDNDLKRPYPKDEYNAVYKTGDSLIQGSWTSNMKCFEGEIKTPYSFDEDSELPPIRSGTNITLTAEGAKSSPTTKTNKRVMPREYRDWDKIDIDKELEKVDDQGDNKVKEKTVIGNKEVTNIPDLGDTSGLSEQEKLLKANREKDKGNEAFRAGDYKEAISYYSRSISLQPTEASYNNRALAYLKHEDWQRALTDTNTVIKMDKNNVKALLRRGSAYKGLKQYTKAKTDLNSVLELEPKNKKAQDLIKDIEKILEKEKEERKTKGKRMVIEDVEGSDEETEQTVNDKEASVNTEPTVEKKQPRRMQIEEVESEEEDEGDNQSPLVNGHEPTSDKDDSVMNNLANESKTSPSDKKEMPNKCDSSKQGSDTTDTSVTRNESKTGTQSNESEQGSQSKPSNLETEQVNSNPEKLAKNSVDNSEKEQVKVNSETAEMLNKSTVIENTTDKGVTAKDDSNKGEDESVSADAVSSDADVFKQPVFYKMDFPENCVSLRQEATNCFKNGQYGDGSEKYTKLINILEKVPDQIVNLSLSYSNRAACHLKTGDLPGAIKDCTKSLELIPHTFKPLLRRAMAYEHLERFDKAYVDYRHVLLIEGSEQQAHLGTKRCQDVLSKKHGPKWREKVKLEQMSQWEIPLIQDISEKDKPVTETRSKPVAAAPKPAVIKTVPEKEPEKVLSPKENFEKVKGKGNDFVKQGKFKEAVQCYTECCEILPDEMVSYTNRALCYIRLNQAENAESDCTRVLEQDGNNVKALFRRAQARKMLENYSDGIKDLKHLLDVDPKNGPAKKEMDLLKNYWREQLQNMKNNMPKKSDEKKTKSPEGVKQSQAVKPESKSRKRMVIEEVESDEEAPPTKGKESGTKKKDDKSKSKSQQKTKIEEIQTPKVKEVKSEPVKTEPKQPVKTDSRSTKSSKTTTKKNAIVETSSGLPRVPKSAPKLGKATPYEFISAWNSLKKSETVQQHYELLKQISPADLTTAHNGLAVHVTKVGAQASDVHQQSIHPSEADGWTLVTTNFHKLLSNHGVISNKLDGTMLNTIVRCVLEHFIKDGNMDTSYQLMHNLSKVPRFGTVSMFMSSKDKSDVKEVLGKLTDHKSSLFTSADVHSLKQAYSV